MALKLGKNKNAIWLDLPEGVRVKVKPLTLAMRQKYEARARRIVNAERERWEEAAKAGELPPDVINFGDPDEESTFFVVELIKASAAALIVEWDGVIDPDSDELAPINETTVADLVSFPAIADSFYAQCADHFKIRAAEGKSSKKDSPGSSEGAGNTAETAAA